MIKHLCIIGIGLMGGSLARALRAANAVTRVSACARDKAQMQKALDLGVIDDFHTDPAEACRGADMVVLAVPVGAMESVFNKIKDVITPEMVLTDVGSTKGSVVEAVTRACGELPLNFVPGHPIAGTEKSGVEASFAELYRHRRVLLTPLATTDSVAVRKVRDMWALCGAVVSETTVEHHDQVLAATSHLPHMLAYTLVDTLAAMDDSQEIFSYAAGGFRDFTRIASSSPQMWHDICVNNREALLKILKQFQGELDVLVKAISDNDSDYLLQMFSRAKRARDQFNDKHLNNASE